MYPLIFDRYNSSKLVNNMWLKFNLVFNGTVFYNMQAINIKWNDLLISSCFCRLHHHIFFYISSPRPSKLMSFLNKIEKNYTLFHNTDQLSQFTMIDFCSFLSIHFNLGEPFIHSPSNFLLGNHIKCYVTYKLQMVCPN